MRVELREKGGRREGSRLGPGDGVPTPLQSYLVPCWSGLGLNDLMLQAPSSSSSSWILVGDRATKQIILHRAQGEFTEGRDRETQRPEPLKPGRGWKTHVLSGIHLQGINC